MVTIVKCTARATFLGVRGGKHSVGAWAALHVRDRWPNADDVRFVAEAAAHDAEVKASEYVNSAELTFEPHEVQATTYHRGEEDITGGKIVRAQRWAQHGGTFEVSDSWDVLKPEFRAELQAKYDAVLAAQAERGVK